MSRSSDHDGARSAVSGTATGGKDNVGLYSFTVAWILGKIIDKTMGFRVSAEDEVTGVDITQHAETAYDLGNIHPAHAASATVTGADREMTARDAEPVAAAD